MEHAELSEKIIGCAMKVHRVLGNGYVESVYGNALGLELDRVRICAAREVPLRVQYAGVDVGCFTADLVVEGVLIVELKAVKLLLPVHEAQMVNYLTATGLDSGLLINFGRERLEFRRKFRTYRSRREGAPAVP